MPDTCEHGDWYPYCMVCVHTLTDAELYDMYEVRDQQIVSSHAVGYG